MKQLEIKKMPQMPFDVAEALNQLRINLSFCGDQVKVVMMTSSVPNEGKSFLTVQLWKMMAELGNKTLLLDCDLRNSEMRRKYNMRLAAQGEKLLGTAHYLAGQAKIEDVIYQTDIPNGYIIPVASTIVNPTILLENDNFTRMIDYCAENFTYVLVDTPPLESVADGLNIARHCDGTVLVVHSGSTPRKLVENSVQLLKRTESPLLGVVLSRANVDNKSSVYYRRYYGRNGYGYGYGGSHSNNKRNNNGGKKHE